MANTLGGGRENKLSRMIQAILRKTMVMPMVASFQEQNTLVKAQSVNRPIFSDVTVSDYTPNVDVIAQDITTTQELLTIDQSKAALVKVDPTEMKQVEQNLDAIYAKRIATAMKQEMECKFFEEVTNASTVIDAGDFGGTAGTPIDLSTVNAERVFSDNFAQLATDDVEMDRPWQAVVDPFTRAAIEQRGIGQLFSLGDSIWRNGFAGQFLNFELFVSNALPASVDLEMATNPTAGDTITLGNQVFTYVAAVGTTPGNILIAGSAAATVDNTVAAINGAAGAGTTYVEIPSKQRVLFTQRKIVAVDGTTSVDLTSCGRTKVSDNLTDGSDGFGDQTIKSLFQRKGAIDAVVQMQPTIQINKAVDNAGHSILGVNLYGFKTFTEGKDRMLQVNIKA